MSLLLRALVVAALVTLSASQPTPARSGKDKGANVAAVCSATKSAWSSASSCAKLQDGICATVLTCPSL